MIIKTEINKYSDLKEVFARINSRDKAKVQNVISFVKCNSIATKADTSEFPVLDTTEVLWFTFKLLFEGFGG